MPPSNVPIAYDGKNHQILIGSAPVANGELSDLTYSAAQVDAIKKEFAKFQSFETAYAPKQIVKGDVYLNAAATDDGVNLVFSHMIVNVSPRDYSDGYESKAVSLSNGTKAKWYTPGPGIASLVTEKYDFCSNDVSNLVWYIRGRDSGFFTYPLN